jgi:hypothetical protein
MCEVGVLGDKQHTDFTRVFLFCIDLASSSLEFTNLLISATIEWTLPMHNLYAGNERIISMLDWFPFTAARASESGRWRLLIIQLLNFLSDRHRGTNRNSPICDRPSWPIPESLG